MKLKRTVQYSNSDEKKVCEKKLIVFSQMTEFLYIGGSLASGLQMYNLTIDLAKSFKPREKLGD